MSRFAHQPPNQPELLSVGVGVDEEEAKGGERKEKGENERNKKRQKGEEEEDRLGCPYFKYAGLNGTDSSDI